MSNPNITPRPENLTRAGKGQPLKGHVRKQVTYPPSISEAIDDAARLQGLSRGEFIAEMAKFLLELGPEQDRYVLSDFELIAQGFGVH